MKLDYQPNGTHHGDVVLQVGSWTTRCDSYFFGLDRAAGRPAPQASLRALLAGWQAEVQACDQGGVAWLPYDFSDQGSGWLRCTLYSDVFEVVAGYSSLEGWAFYPSGFRGGVARLSDFQVLEDFGRARRRERAALIEDIRASHARLQR